MYDSKVGDQHEFYLVMVVLIITSISLQVIFSGMPSFVLIQFHRP